MLTLDQPTKLTRSQLTALVRTLGIDPEDAVELHVTPDLVELVVRARNEAGCFYCHASGEPAVHRIALEVVEGE